MSTCEKLFLELELGCHLGQEQLLALEPQDHYFNWQEKQDALHYVHSHTTKLPLLDILHEQC